MKILMVHKFYYIEGGAERYVFNLTDLLKAKGHQVIPFSMQHPRNFSSEYSDYFADYFNPNQFQSKSPVTILKKAARVIYNRAAQRQLEELIKKTKPDIAHVHSVYHHLSPAILSTLKAYNIPVILTLHDFKLVCPNIVLLDGKNRVCQLCKGRHFWHVFLKKCFRNSYAASLLVWWEASIHKYLKSYIRNVDLFHSPSLFLASKIVELGLPKKRVKVLPYTLDVGHFSPTTSHSDYFVYIGRLSVEKGVLFLMDVMQHVRKSKLYIIGTGPLEEELRTLVHKRNLHNVSLLGYKSGDELKKLLSGARFMVLPSLCHDNSPLAIYEALSMGKPVIGARMGGIPELVEDEENGYIFEPGDAIDCADKINHLQENQQLIPLLGTNARKKAERRFDFEHHYQSILRLYEETKIRANPA